jgi:hypothetical protein
MQYCLCLTAFATAALAFSASHNLIASVQKLLGISWKRKGVREETSFAPVAVGGE